MSRAFRQASLPLTGLLLVVAGRAGAATSIDLTLQELAGPGWRLDAPRAELSLAGQVPVLTVHVPRVLNQSGEVLAESVGITCRGVVLSPTHLACPEGELGAVLPPASERLGTSLGFVLRRSDGRWSANGVARLGDGLHWRAEADGAGITGSIRAGELSLSAVQPWLPRLPGPVVSVSGTLSNLEASARLPSDGPVTASLKSDAAELGFDTETGLMAAAGVGGSIELQWSGEGEEWRARVDASVAGGELLAGTFYTSLGGEPLEISGSVAASGGQWRLDSVRVNDPDSVAFSGSAVWDWASTPSLVSLDARLDQARFPGFYDDLLQPVLAQYGFGDLSTGGNLSGRLRVAEGEPRDLDISLDHVDVNDSAGRLQFTDLNGDIRWTASGEALASNLTWQGGQVYSIGLGSADIRAAASGDDFRLTQQTLLPVLDGALVINSLAVEDWFGEQPHLLFDARLMPISLDVLSKALGWPGLQGSLAGRIPELTFRDGVYRLGGSLVVDVFDGAVLVENLRIERPFGVLPKLVADISLNDLDLELLTGVFTIGRITGRVAGFVKNLRLLDWEPVHFDARVATPADDESRHRISQRAVDTLTDLGGGGPGGALSRSFLRVFDEFAYRQLGVTCTLRNNVCEMGGVKPAPNGGYYIVEGGGLPRVDVIGHVRRVDWPVLMVQLIQAMQGRGPSVGREPAAGDDS